MNSIFSKQNFVLKLILIIFGILMSSFANFKLLLMLSVITVIYLLFDPKILLYWLRGFIKLSPLFTSIFLFGLFFSIPFDLQLILAGRILLILLFSVYLTVTTTVEDFLADTIFLPQNDFFKNSRIFLIAIFQFVPFFLDQYKMALGIEKNYFVIAKITLQNSFQKIQEVEDFALEKMENVIGRKFQIMPNMYIISIFIAFGILTWIL